MALNPLHGSVVMKHDYSDAERKEMSKSGAAMPGGRYPIANATDVENAVMDWARSGEPADVKEHIIRRARAVGATDKLPKDWNASK